MKITQWLCVILCVSVNALAMDEQQLPETKDNAEATAIDERQPIDSSDSSFAIWFKQKQVEANASYSRWCENASSFLQKTKSELNADWQELKDGLAKLCQRKTKDGATTSSENSAAQDESSKDDKSK